VSVRLALTLVLFCAFDFPLFLPVLLPVLLPVFFERLMFWSPS